MNRDKWRVRRDPRFHNRWVVFAPNRVIRASLIAGSHGDAIKGLDALLTLERLKAAQS